jgi:hypothetical protein
MAVSGCAINPYIANPRPPRPDVGSPTETTASLARALAYADNTFDAYDAKLAEEFTRQQLVSGSLLTLGAVTLGLAAGHAHRDAYLTTALTGGLVYQLGTWNSNKDRLGIYVEGMKAIACAKSAVAPLVVGATTLESVQAREKEVLSQVRKVSSAAGRVVRWLSIVGSTHPEGATSQLEKAAQDELAQQASALKRANDALSRASGLRVRVDGAGNQLNAHIDQIRRAISLALNGTLSDLAQLRGVIQSLSDYASIFAEGLDLRGAAKNEVAAANKSIAPQEVTQQSGADPTAGEVRQKVLVDPVGALADSLGRLRAERQVLAAEVSILNGAVEPKSLAKLKTELSSCGVDPSKLNSALNVDRAAVSFESGTAGTSLVTISGGTLPYSASLIDLPAKGISVSAPAGGSIVVITAGTDTEPGKSYVVNVGDSAGLIAAITISVNGKQSGGTGGASGGESGAANAAAKNKSAQAAVCEGQQARSPEEICLLQAAVKVPVTGKFDAKTCKAFRSAPLTQRFTGLVDTTAINAIEVDMKLSPGASADAIRTALANQGVQSCNGIALVKTAAVAPSATGACPAPDASKGCNIEGARCAFECTLSKGEVGVLRRKLSLSPTPERFDEPLRTALGRFQASNKLQNQRGEYTEESARALQDVK